jgi:hypothetical protein
MTKREKEAHRARMDALHAEAKRIVATGKCPDCGARLRRNNSMAGWWQCGRLGAPGFKLPEYEGKGDCSFQCFTE